MGDILCRICGEPWDSYGVYHGDMEEFEKEIFLRGKGCPCCKGKKKDNKDHTSEFIESALEETDDPDSVLDMW